MQADRVQNPLLRYYSALFTNIKRAYEACERFRRQAGLPRVIKFYDGGPEFLYPTTYAFRKLNGSDGGINLRAYPQADQIQKELCENLGGVILQAPIREATQKLEVLTTSWVQIDIIRASATSELTTQENINEFNERFEKVKQDFYHLAWNINHPSSLGLIPYLLDYDEIKRIMRDTIRDAMPEIYSQVVHQAALVKYLGKEDAIEELRLNRDEADSLRKSNGVIGHLDRFKPFINRTEWYSVLSTPENQRENLCQVEYDLFGEDSPNNWRSILERIHELSGISDEDFREI